MGAFNEFSITKTQTKPLPDGMAVARNAKVTYEIKVKNDGTDPATNVVVRDFLPAGADYIEATGTNMFLCSEVGNYIECVGGQLGKIGSGTEEATITISMFAPDTPGNYTNQAIVDPLNAKPEGNEFNNQVNVPLTVNNGGIGAFIDLTISKTPETDTVKPKDPITYVLTVTNAGRGAGAERRGARRPAGRRDVPLGRGHDDCAGRPRRLHLQPRRRRGELHRRDAGRHGEYAATPDIPATRTITIKVTAPIFNVPTSGLMNQAFVDPDNAIPEGDETNNSDTSRITVSSAIDLRVRRTARPSPTRTRCRSTRSRCSTTSRRDGTTPRARTPFGVQVFDPLPVGLIPLSVFTDDDANFTCSVAENPINVVRVHR